MIEQFYVIIIKSEVLTNFKRYGTINCNANYSERISFC